MIDKRVNRAFINSLHMKKMRLNLTKKNNLNEAFISDKKSDFINNVRHVKQKRIKWCEIALFYYEILC